MSILPERSTIPADASLIHPWGSTAAFSLERLPLLALEAVCEYLATINRDLCAFSLTCVRYATVSRRYRLQHIRLRDTPALRHELSRLQQALRPNLDSHLGHVRRLTLTGGTLSPLSPPTQDDGSGEDDVEIKKPRLPKLKGIFQAPTICCSTLDGQKQYSPFYASSPEAKAERNALWMPVAHFIGSLPCLTDLVYDCTYEVPTCLLQALHEKCPTARLHVNHFSLRSLYQPIRDPYQAISLDEYMLVTSPCLYSIAMRWFRFDDDGRIGFKKEAVTQMVSSSAPNLKSVAMESDYPGDSAKMRLALAIPEDMLPKWKGFSGNGLESALPRKGHLHSLSCGSSDIDAWAEVTNFKELLDLKLKYLSLRDVRSLNRAAQCDGDGFSSLRSLALSFHCPDAEAGCTLDGETAMLMRTLWPLETLFLRGFVGEDTFQAVLDKHGATLRQFQLVPSRSYSMDAVPLVLRPQHVERLSSHCTALERLEILISRTEGDEQEATIYRTLGQLTRLESISLRLNCSCSQPVRADDPAPELGTTRPIPTSTLRRALINTAVDSRLALSIFEVIAKQRENHVSYVKVQVENVGEFEPLSWDSDFDAVLRWVARNWVCERDSGRGTVSVREIAHDDDDILGDGDDGELLRADFDEREDLRAVWTSIWPGSDRDRRYQWESLPLACAQSPMGL